MCSKNQPVASPDSYCRNLTSSLNSGINNTYHKTEPMQNRKEKLSRIKYEYFVTCHALCNNLVEWPSGRKCQDVYCVPWGSSGRTHERSWGTHQLSQP